MKKFIFIALLVLLVALFAFHFFAANEAEKQIDTAIQLQADSVAIPVSVQYSSIDVSPFSGNINFSDVTIVEESNIERAQKINVNLGYIDFLNIYLGGTKYGLQNLENGTINLGKVSYVNRQTLQEFSIDTLNIDYSGNMWDAIQSIFNGTATTYKHNVKLSGTGGSYTKPNSSVGSFLADSVLTQFTIPKETTEWIHGGKHQISFKKITWSPPASFQNKYGFFIQGFGYKLDAIPIQKVGTSYTVNDSRLNISNGVLETELFTANFDGTIQTDTTWADATYNPLNISIVDLSEEFSNILTNVEQLFGITLPGKTNNNKIHFQLVGPVTEPTIQKTTASALN